MIGQFFTAFIYVPIYNALAGAVGVVPYGDIGIAIILITVLIKLILFPLALRASHTQHMMRKLEPELTKIRVEHKDNQEQLAKKTLSLYSENGINPFFSFLVLLIQIPVILGLYWVISAEKTLGTFDPTLLYSFVSNPTVVSYLFLGLIPIREASIVLALIVGITQYYQAQLMMPTPPTKTGKNFQDELAASMHIQVRYVLPVILTVIAYVTGGAIALYFVTSNIFGILQEVVVRNRLTKTT